MREKLKDKLLKFLGKYLQKVCLIITLPVFNILTLHLYFKKCIAVVFTTQYSQSIFVYKIYSKLN